MRPLRISVLANVPLQENLGSGYVILGHIRCLQELGHNVRLATTFPRVRPRNGRGNAFRTRLGMIRLVPLARRSDVVFVWGGEAGWVMPYAAKMRKRGLILAASNGLDTHVRAAVDGLSPEVADSSHTVNAFRKSDGLLVISKFDFTWALDRGYQPENRIAVVQNPLQESFLERPVKWSRRPLALYVGRPQGIKGYGCILEMLRRRRPTGVRLVLIGISARKLTEDLSGLAPCDLEAVPGGLSRQELIQWYEQAAIMFLPSMYESFGLVVAEGMACGAAAVATPTGFAWQLEDRREVLHVPFGDADALAEALELLARDEQMRLAIAKNGYQRVQELRWPNAKAQLAAFLERMQQEGPKGQ